MPLRAARAGSAEAAHERDTAAREHVGGIAHREEAGRLERVGELAIDREDRKADAQVIVDAIADGATGVVGRAVFGAVKRPARE